jgi:hypothetical protein
VKGLKAETYLIGFEDVCLRIMVVDGRKARCMRLVDTVLNILQPKPPDAGSEEKEKGQGEKSRRSETNRYERGNK